MYHPDHRGDAPKLVQMVLESITVKGNGEFEIRFFDGTEFAMKF